MKYITIFLMGAAGYSGIEVLWRGYTHWTMSLCGGFCFLMIYFLNDILISESIFFRCFAGSAVITAVELIVGVTVNMILKWNVWDYSSVPFNFMGQICLPYSILWFFLCIPVLWICTGINKLI
ncbi:MAG: hypothetical protein IJ454_04550 [Clostridia bacterium]|nr:hypothetical protein [Clostridia bacterium]